MAICALILGAGFTPAVPSTVDPVRPAPVSFNAAPAPAERSTVDDSAPAARPAEPVTVTVVADRPLPDSRCVGAVAGRAPPPHQA